MKFSEQLTLQDIFFILKQTENQIEEDILMWKTRMDGKFAKTYIKIRQEQFEAISSLRRDLANILNL